MASRRHSASPSPSPKPPPRRPNLPTTLTAPISPPLKKARVRQSPPIPIASSKNVSRDGAEVDPIAQVNKEAYVSLDRADPSAGEEAPRRTAMGSISSAAIEAGQIVIDVEDHLGYWVGKLASHVRSFVAPPPPPSFPPSSCVSSSHQPTSSSTNNTNINNPKPHKDHYQQQQQQQPPHSHSLLPIPSFKSLYAQNQHPSGHHFVIHQHDHPISGTHYDLRLQISETSSVSWAVVYGMPGDPGSKRLLRGAVETRVHNFWNHLIETASKATGSMLIWDTGVYEVLPVGSAASSSGLRGGKGRRRESTPRSSASSSSGSESRPESRSRPRGILKNGDNGETKQKEKEKSEPEKLAAAFKMRKINLRLHGTKLPRGYTIRLRLTKDDDRAGQPRAPAFKRGRRGRRRRRSDQIVNTESESGVESEHEKGGDGKLKNGSSDPATATRATTTRAAIEAELQEAEDEEIRRTNAYPGATNSIGSIHQRKWFLSLDREASGFVREGKGGGWVRRRDGEEGEGGEGGGFAPFYVLGREVERSVVTGRTAGEVLRDEGVEGFVGRRGWRGIVE